MAFVNPKETIPRLGLREGMIVSDFGTGTGEYALAASSRVGTSGKVYAVDIQKDLFPILRSRAEEAGANNIELLWGDAEEEGGVPIKTGLCDAVIISNLLFQAENKDTLVGEANRVLKHGGKTLVIDWADSFGHLGPTPEMVFTKSSARELFSRHGFKEIANFDTGEHHYALVFEKV